MQQDRETCLGQWNAAWNRICLHIVFGPIRIGTTRCLIPADRLIRPVRLSAAHGRETRCRYMIAALLIAEHSFHIHRYVRSSTRLTSDHLWLEPEPPAYSLDKKLRCVTF